MISLLSAGPAYDALLVVSFGGPDRPDDVLPFLENVLRGRNVPRERMLAVAEHYYHFGGASPINAQNRALIAALDAELKASQLDFPIYYGNRNWHPLLPDTLRDMRAAGVRRALAFFTSAFSSYSGCRQYRENIVAAQAEIGAGAPQIDKLRSFYNHPGFLEPFAERVRDALAHFPATRRDDAKIFFTAHSIPSSMAAGCNYVTQLNEAAKLVSQLLGGVNFSLVYQSRSGSPAQPWLEPDILDALRAHRASGGSTDVVIAPLGFISDHMEVLYDLDTEAEQLCRELGINMRRAGTVGTHPRFVKMIRQLIEERLDPQSQRWILGDAGPVPDACPPDCCLPGVSSRPPPTSPR